jgi:pimeloyl-ACP methyl ester carboxylesterase
MGHHALMLRFLAVCLVACSAKEEAKPAEPPYVPPPATAVIEPGIVRELIDVDGVVPEKNPVRNAETPREQNRVRVVRYRPEATKKARAVVILMPGFLGGAGSFDPLARAIVRRGLTDPGGAVEAWAIDRRSNYLEDTHGDDVAEVRRDPSAAAKYYYEGEPVAGKTFSGFIDQSAVPHISEWGAATTLGDLRNVIARVPDKKSRVILVGHSLGATLAEAYAAWDFGGQRGYDDLAGLVLVDGVAGNELDASTTFSEKTYLEGQTDSANPFAASGLNTIRKVQPFVALPLIGVAALEQAERMAIATAFSPTALRLAHEDITNLTAVLLGLDRKKIPAMTNRAAFGLAFDDASTAVFFAAISAGAITGGPVEKYKGILGGELIHPTDPAASYDWIEFDATTPKERSRLADMARSWFEGPGLNFGEWYFPMRLALDAGVVGSLNIADDDWRAKYGLRARYGAAIDVPVLGVAAGLVAESRFDKLRAMLTAPIGPGRPLAGTARTDPRAYQLLAKRQFTHIDPVQAADVGEGKTWYDELYAFITTNTPPL